MSKKKLTFATAREKLKRVSKGEYRGMYYELTEGSIGPCEILCKVYVNNFGFHSAETWEGALASLWKAMHPKKKGPVSLDQSPSGDK